MAQATFEKSGVLVNFISDVHSEEWYTLDEEIDKVYEKLDSFDRKGISPCSPEYKENVRKLFELTEKQRCTL